MPRESWPNGPDRINSAYDQITFNKSLEKLAPLLGLDDLMAREVENFDPDTRAAQAYKFAEGRQGRVPYEQLLEKLKQLMSPQQNTPGFWFRR